MTDKSYELALCREIFLVITVGYLCIQRKSFIHSFVYLIQATMAHMTDKVDEETYGELSSETISPQYRVRHT